MAWHCLFAAILSARAWHRHVGHAAPLSPRTAADALLVALALAISRIHRRLTREGPRSCEMSLERRTRPKRPRIPWSFHERDGRVRDVLEHVLRSAQFGSAVETEQPGSADARVGSPRGVATAPPAAGDRDAPESSAAESLELAYRRADEVGDAGGSFQPWCAAASAPGTLPPPRPPTSGSPEPRRGLQPRDPAVRGGGISLARKPLGGDASSAGTLRRQPTLDSCCNDGRPRRGSSGLRRRALG